MHRLKILDQMRKSFVPRSMLARTVTAVTVVTIGATKVVIAASPPPQTPSPPPPPKDCDPDKPLIRAKDLPIYYDPDSKLSKKKPCKEEEYPDDILMSAVKWSRAELWNAKNEIDSLKTRATDFIETGKSHASTALEQLYEPENVNQRYGVIGAGALLGFLYGLRGGFFRKLFYTSVGAAAGTAICYPDETYEVANPIITDLHELLDVGYEFFRATVKDLTGTEITVPELVKTNPFETVKEWIGKSTDDDNVSKSSQVAETPIAPVAAVSSSSPLKAGSIPMPPLEKPSKASN